jgi:hypothetical protein
LIPLRCARRHPEARDEILAVSSGHRRPVKVDYYADFTEEVDQYRAEQREFERRERERWERSERVLG